MERIHAALRGLALCAALAASPLAQAGGEAYARLSGFTITLTDLDATDGIAPSFTILGQGYGSSGFFATGAFVVHGTEVDTVTRANTAGSVMRSVVAYPDAASPSAGASATYESGNDPGQHVFQAGTSFSGTLGEARQASSLSGYGSGNELVGLEGLPYAVFAGEGAPAPGFVQLQLSPNTRLEITADAFANSVARADCLGCTEYHIAEALLSLDELRPGVPGTAPVLVTLASDGLSAESFADASAPGVDTRTDDTRLLRLSFDNRTAAGDTPVARVVHLNGIARTTSFAAAVPEPGTWAMLAPGLAAAAWAARRRKAG